MKALTTVAMYGLVHVPPAHDMHAVGDSDNQPSVGDDANAALARMVSAFGRER